MYLRLNQLMLMFAQDLLGQEKVECCMFHPFILKFVQLGDLKGYSDNFLLNL